MTTQSSKTIKYVIRHSENLGRYLVAAKNISAGEVIIKEEPVAVGPATFNKYYLCFVCLRVLQIPNKKSIVLCSKCNVAPVCDLACENSTGHHTENECNLFKENKEVFSDNTSVIEILMHLRIWLIKVNNSELWEKINELEDHENKRRNTTVWKEREEDVVDVFRKMKLIPESDKDAGELIQKICGILDVNSFELRSPGSVGESLLRGLYIQTSMIAHECRGNTQITVDDQFQLIVFASLPIQEGETIYFNYTSSFLGTIERREHLRKGKYFECKCPACLDPFECGSNLSSIFCPRCRKGYIAVQDPMVFNPYKKDTKWQCGACKKLYHGCLIRSTLEICKTLISKVEKPDVKTLETLLTSLSKSLHTNHFMMLNIKHKLLTEYRRELVFPNPQKKTLQRILELCKDIYNVLEIVEPGISRLKGIMLYEMHFCFVILADREFLARQISTHDHILKLEEGKKLLKDGLKMLLLEPTTTPEGILAKRAMKELKILTQKIDDVKSLPLQETDTQNDKKKNNLSKQCKQ